MADKKFADKQVYRVFIDAPVETVWAELVKQKAPRPFFWNGEWDTPEFAAGQPFRIAANGGKIVAVIGRILEMDPPRKLVHSFRLTSLDDPASTVTYLLEEKDGGTAFSLVTENVPVGAKSEKSMDQGAKFIVENFKRYVETGKISFMARATLAFYALLSPITPKAMRAESWPLERAE